MEALIRIQAEVVLEARQKALTAKAALAEARARWEAENADLIAAAKEAAEVVPQEEDVLRELALNVYRRTGNKKPGPGVEIWMTTVAAYNSNDALDWAVQHRIALKLDEKEFERIAKASKLSFVTIDKEPKAAIASDLGKALGNGVGAAIRLQAEAA